MAMTVPEGDYPALSRSQRLYETEGGALMLAFECELQAEQKRTLIARITLVKKDGEVMINNKERMQSVFGWNGQDPFWFVDTDLSQIPFSVTVVKKVVQPKDGSEPYEISDIAWINPPGGHGAALPENADRKSVLAKYGAKFRALAGGTPVAAPKQGIPAPAVPSIPPPDKNPGLPGLPPPAPVKPINVKQAVAKMEDAWKALCEANPGKTQEELQQLWYKGIESTKKAQGDLTPENWHRLMMSFSDDIPY